MVTALQISIDVGGCLKCYDIACVRVYLTIDSQTSKHFFPLHTPLYEISVIYFKTPDKHKLKP